MNRCASAKSGLNGAVKEALPCGIDIALERATKGQCFVSVINQIEGPIITLRDGRDQVKFQPTCGKPTTFRAKCERPI